MTDSSKKPWPRAVLFDFDGTLIDSYPAIAASVNHVRSLHGLSPLDLTEVIRHVGRGPNHLLQMTVDKGDVAENVKAYRQHHPSVLRPLTGLLPGAAETLADLHAQGKRLGICSNKPVGFTRDLIDHLDIAKYLEVILGPEDVPNLKPAPDMLLAAMERLELPASEILYVGDMTVDIETGRGAGVAVWVVPTGSDTLEALKSAKPDRVLTNLRSMLDALPT